MNMNLAEELKWRGFVNQTTLGDLSELDKKKWVFYHGYDASSDSLTVGNLAALMMDKCFVRHGHKAVLLAGGATSLIGDPGGKDSERPLQSAETVRANVAKVKTQIDKLFDGKAEIANNLDWFKDMKLIEFLRDVGKHFSMTPLVQRDYIAKRIGQEGAGISYTEFSYTLMQGYDFLRLFEDRGVCLQLAGADQWGNGLSGVELVRRVKGAEVHVLTCPLVINKATGKKFGKSEDGAVWLDEGKTSVYKFYQFWLNADDEGVESYLKIFTELGKEKIDQIMHSFNDNKGGRLAQKTLAYEVTKLVHGAEAAETQKLIAEVLFGSEDSHELDLSHFELLEKELPTATLQKHAKTEDIIQALVETGLASSKTEARRFVENGAIYINNIKMPSNYLFDAGLERAVIRRGKNTNAVLKIVG